VTVRHIGFDAKISEVAVYQSIYYHLAFTPPVLSARLPAVVELYGTAHNRLAACACVCVLPAGKAST
jgi:hypothetical protein